ncbi:MAG: transcription elongation factor GreA [Candidatus Peribacteraceae bacterium]|nr:transcription elongation factor GreA [Candidatus Peribacteraceae bacterium]
MNDENSTKDELTEEDLTLAGKSTAGDDSASADEGEDEGEDGSAGGDDQQTLVTREGLKKLKDELEELENVRRREVAARLKEAISFGDLSENSEYEDAKNEQALVENRIAELKRMIKTAKIITEKKSSGKIVKIGSTVTIQNLTDKDEPETYTIVGSTEADPTSAKISNESPIGIAIMDKEQGEEVMVTAPAGELKYKIVKVS